MGKRTKLIFVLMLLLFGTVMTLAAQQMVIPVAEGSGYAIASYEFSIKGKTNKIAIREAIVPADGDPIYKSQDALVAALERKRQNLINRQIFMSVEYEWEIISYVDGIVNYKATFYIEDSSTFLALPYPKFDNDTTGLLLGVKAKDTNFFGTLGELNLTAYISQNDGTLETWDHKKEHVSLDIKQVKFWNTNLNLNLVYNRQKSKNPLGDFSYAIDWSGVPLFSQRLSFHFEGIADPTAARQKFEYNIGLGNLDILGAKATIKTWGKLLPSTEDPTDLGADLFGLSFAYGPFRQNEARYSISILAEVNSKLTNLKTEMVLTQHDLRFLTKPLSFNIKATTNQRLNKESVDTIVVSSTLGTSFSLPFRIRWATTASAAVSYKENREPFHQFYFDLVNTVSGARGINYLSSLHKFRRGLTYSVKHFYRFFPQNEYIDDTYWYLEGNVTWFPLAVWRLNPAIRLNGFYVDNNAKTKFEFLPSNKNLDVSDYMRGSLSTSSQIKKANGVVDYGVVANLSMLIDFIDFGFAKSYANPFIDIGYFGSPGFDDGHLLLASIGLEGWGVLRRFPSHPLRASLGFNLLDIVDAFKGEIEGSDIEWKISISFELHF